MKNTLLASLLFLLATSSFAQNNPAPAGTDIQFTVKPYRNQWIFLAYYYGSIKALTDSIFLNAESRGVYKSEKPLPQGIYIVASPSKSILFEMVLGEDQQFTATLDTLDMQSLEISGSKDNDDFKAYTNFMTPRAINADVLGKELDTATGANKKRLTDEITLINKQINDYRNKLIETDPNSMLATLFKCMKEPEYPDAMRNPKTKKDSLTMYRYGKDHYWDNVDFMDGRLVRTPVFEPKLTQYLQSWVSPEPDSIIYESNWMIALGRNDPEMYRFITGYFVDRYMYPKIMGQDKVFLHMYNNYIAGDKPKMDWLNERQLKTIRERAYMLMANQIGTQAWDMQLVDTAGVAKNLYDLKADYTIISFWDVHCGKCKEEMPKLDSLYNAKWKKKNVKVYAVMVNESAVADWKPYIRKIGAGWTHVHQTQAMRTKEEKEGKPNYRQLYDMRSTPTLFLLDKEKRIMAKNISLPDLDKVLDQKFATPTK